MADVKFTGLPAGSGVPDNGSLVAISTYDGASTYTSEKYTMTQLKDIVYVMEAGDKITFDSSGTKVFASDSNSNAEVVFNPNSKDEVYLQTDSGQATPYFGVYSNGVADRGYELYTVDYYNLVQGTEWALAADGFTLQKKVIQIDNSGNAWTTTNTADNPVIALSTRNASIDAGITNALVAGGVGINANKDDYLFSGKHELQLATEDFSFEDAGSTSATEQDWIEVSVGGVTGYIRVFATK